jgi:tetratricopeptide (TPR) repeat protein
MVIYAAFLLAAIPTASDPGWKSGLFRTSAAPLVGLALALVAAAFLKLREGVRPGNRPFAFLLFLLLESSNLVYIGVIGGMAVGAWWAREMLHVDDPARALLTPTLLFGGVAGAVAGVLRQVRDALSRILLLLGLAAAFTLVGMAYLGLTRLEWLGITEPYRLANPVAFAVQILVGLPYFYLLTFSGHEEESEAEVALMCGMLGASLGILIGDSKAYILLLPLGLFLFYTLRVLPGLRVFKHAIRGLGYARGGRHRKALMAFRRALQLDPENPLARAGFWEVHCSLDLDRIADDHQTLALVDLELCLSRAGALLLRKPTEAQKSEAERLLALVERLQPARKPQAQYWRAVAAAHAGDIDSAAGLLERVIDPTYYGPEDPYRRAALLPAWQMALRLHPGLKERVGAPQLARPGRRMEAIAAVERALAAEPGNRDVIELKKLLYAGIDEAEYNTVAPEGTAAPDFDHDYAEHLGLGLINDDGQWQRGGEYLRLAARGLPSHGTTLFVQIANAQRRVGLLDEARHNYELAKRAGLSIGQRNLADEERQAYFSVVRYLAEEALHRGDADAAIENFRLYSESEHAGIATLRTLADLYEKKGDALAAARATDQALAYNSADPELLERKDRYYYSIQPEDLAARLEHYGPGLDVPYCLDKARSILDRHADLDWLDVARHLLKLALVVKPNSLAAKVLMARTLLRYGEREEAMTLLEEARGPEMPSSFLGDDGDWWFVASQILGDLYLEAGKPEQAITCLNDFRKSPKSGARTWLKLGQAYEMTGDLVRAKKCYSQVTAYQGNPLVSEASDALARLG